MGQLNWKMMRTMLKYTAWLTAALMTLACGKDPAGLREVPAAGLGLRFECADLVVKAGEGETAFNENLIKTLDVYFYPAGGTGNNAVFHETMDPNVQNMHSATVNFTTAEVSTLFTGTTCTVYALANIDRSLLPSSLSGTSVAELKALALAQDKFGSQAGSNHAPASFVMEGQQDIELISTTSTTVASGTVPLYRIASKLSLMVHVEPSIRVPVVYKDEENNEYPAEEEWVPMTGVGTSGAAQVQAYLVNGYSLARIGVRTQPETYLPNTRTADASAYYDYRSNPMEYTPSHAETVSEPERYTWQQHILNPTQVTEDMVGTLTGNTKEVTYMVSDPSYTYPETWTQGAETEPYFKLVLPWRRTANLYVYKNGKENEPELVAGKTGQKQYYYKILFPNKNLLSNNWYQYKIHVGILGSDTDDAKVELVSTYMVADWQNKSEVLEEAEVGNARYLSVAQEAYTLYNETTLDIPYITSDNCEIVNARYSRMIYSGGNGTVQSGTAASVGATFTLQDSKIHFVHDIDNQMSEDMDVSPYTFTFTIRHTDDTDGNFSRDVTIYQYPAIYISQVTGGNVYIDGYYGNVNGSKGPNYTNHRYGDTYTMTPYMTVTTSLSGLGNLTRITVSAFSSGENIFRSHLGDREYIIGDSRMDSGWSAGDLVNYRNGNTTYSWGDKAGAIQIGGDNPQIIAPSILVASYWSAMNGQEPLSYENALKRCATYQEAGYPAGRWRLPTEAEVYYIEQLQENNHIITLFNDQYHYWTSTGYGYRGRDNNYKNSGTDPGARCVYDVWYWGEETMSTDTYHPEP